MRTKTLLLALATALAGLVASLAQPSDLRVIPTTLSVSLGVTATFRVYAAGTTPFTYQWWFTNAVGESPLHGVENPSALGNILNLTNVQVASAGGYYVVVTDANSLSATSGVVTLGVDPTFVKITEGHIATDREPSQSGTWCDYDNDGLLDLFVANGNPAARSSLYHQEPDGSFTRVTNAVTSRSLNSWAGLWADYDNDGDTDLFVTGSLNELFSNGGNGQLLSTTLPPQMAAASQNGAWGDIDGDGWLDLFLTTSGNDRLFRNLGDGNFQSLTAAEAGPLVSDGANDWIPAFCDYDNDGNLDLFVGCLGSPSFLYRNLGGGRFEKVRAGSLPAAQAAGGVWADFNNDGYFDLFTTTPVGALHLNLAGQGFQDVTQAAFGRALSGNAYGPAWGDYDNDGDLDLFIPYYNGPTNLMFRNNGDGTFTSIGVGSPLREGTTDEAACWIDYDNDGFLDLFVACGEGSPAPNLLYHNNLRAAGNSNHWFKVQLRGTASNGSGIGAKVYVLATIGNQQVRQVRQIASNGGWGGGLQFVAHFGLGDATNVDLVQIEWPSGIVQELSNVPANQILTITEHQANATNAPSLTATNPGNDSVQVTATGPTNLLYVFEASTNLAQWTKVAVRTNLTGAVEYGPATSTSSQRFYRVQVP